MVRAMVECLDLPQKCRMLLEEFSRTSLLRDALLRKISEDENATSNAAFGRMVASLLELVRVGRGNDSQAAGYCISQLSSVCTKSVLDKITINLLSCRYVSNRRRGYRLARAAMKKRLLIQVKKNWEIYRDREAARIVIEHCSTSYLAERKKEFLECFTDVPWHVARLYILLAKASIGHLHDLRASDEITYAYVVTKLGRKLGYKEALGIFERNVASERLGLLIWCFGKQRLWPVLSKLSKEWNAYENRYHDSQRERMAALTESLFGKAPANPPLGS